jgi:hypothetical protein
VGGHNRINKPHLKEQVSAHVLGTLTETYVRLRTKTSTESFHRCTVHFDVIKSYICPTNAHLNCFKMLKFTLKIAMNAPTCLGLTKQSSESLRCVLR